MNTRKMLKVGVAALAAIALFSGCGSVPPPAQPGGPNGDNNTVNPQATAPETTAPGGNTGGNQAPSTNDQAGIIEAIKAYTGGIFHAVDAAKLEALGDTSKLSLEQIKSVYNPNFIKYMYDEDMPEMAQKAFWGLLTMVGGIGALLPENQIEVEIDASKIVINGDTATIPGSAISLKVMGQKSSEEDQSDLTLIKHNGVWKIHISKI